MKQKFKKLKFVRVCKEMPCYMEHFDSDFDAIVCGTYSQIYGGGNIGEYSLYKIEGGKIVNRICWYEESQLSLLADQNHERAEQMIEDYNLTESNNENSNRCSE